VPVQVVERREALRQGTRTVEQQRHQVRANHRRAPGSRAPPPLKIPQSAPRWGGVFHFSGKAGGDRCEEPALTLKVV
jgi:hypothetical protein